MRGWGSDAPSARALGVVKDAHDAVRSRRVTVRWSGRYLEAVDDGGWEYVRRVSGMSAAVVIAITDDGEAVLIEQHRPAVGANTIEFVAGLIGDADGPGEDARETAERELMEEAGFAARTWRDLGEFAASAGITAETFHLFLATGLERRTAGGGVGKERITVHLIKLAELAAFTAAKRATGCVIDARLIAFLPWASFS